MVRTKGGGGLSVAIAHDTDLVAFGLTHFLEHHKANVGGGRCALVISRWTVTVFCNYTFLCHT